MDLAGQAPLPSGRHDTFDGKRATLSALGAAAALRGATFLLTAAGDVEHLDAGAAAWLARGAPLTVNGRRLGAVDATLDALLAAAIAALSRHGAVKEVVFGFADSADSAQIRCRLAAQGESGSLCLRVSSGDTVLDHGQPLQRLARRGFTTAESGCALLLVDGLSIDQIAARQGVSRNTVRAHLRSLYAKTGTHRQAALAAVVHRVLSVGEP